MGQTVELATGDSHTCATCRADPGGHGSHCDERGSFHPGDLSEEARRLIGADNPWEELR